MGCREQDSNFNKLFYDAEHAAWFCRWGPLSFNAPTREILEEGMAQKGGLPLEQWTIEQLSDGRWSATRSY